MEPWPRLLLLCQICACLSEDPRRRLLEDLLGETSGYRKELTPVKDPSKPVQVEVGLTLHQIRALEERHQYLHIMTWLRFIWRDEYLTWNASDYGNVTRLHIPASDMWRPDIVLYNSVDEERQAAEIMPETNIQVRSDGQVKWSGPTLLQSSCKIRVAEYPFDIQRCPLKFGSWTYHGWELNLTETAALMKGFVPNEEWTVIGMPAERHDTVYECCPEPYPDITFTLIIKRKPMFYLFNLLFPCVLLMILGILVFCLPPESGEKVSLAITVLLAMSVYQLIIMENIPRTSDEIPVLNQYFSASIVMLCLSTILAVLVMNWHFDGIHGVRAPRWVRVFVLEKLSKIVCLSKETGQKSTSEKAKNGITNSDAVQARRYLAKDDNTELVAYDNPDRVVVSNCTPKRSEQSLPPLGTAEQILQEIRDYKQSSDHSANIESEWKLIALILDRTFMIIFVILTTAVTIGIFAKVAGFEGS